MKSNKIRGLVLVVLALNIFSPTTWAKKGPERTKASTEDFSNVKAQLENILRKSGLKNEGLGLAVAPLIGDNIFALNENKKLIPASLSKLVTAAGVADGLYPAHQFHTQIYTDGTQVGNTLKGNIYLKGGGDPAFVSEKMWFLVNEFYRTGIRKVDGKLFVDASIFDDELFDPSREDARVDRAYDAPVSGMSFNWNSTTIYIRPGAKSGDKASVWVDPPNEYIKLVEKVITGSKTDLSAARESKGNYEEVTVSGKIAVGAPEYHIYKNVTNPPLFAAANLREFMRQRGIEISGATAKGIVPKEAKLAADCPSDPLSKLLADMGKFSNNYVAEMLTKNLAAVKVGTPAHLTDGVAKLKEFLSEKAGIPSDQFTFINPSGLTRKNQFSANQFITIMRYVQSHFSIFPETIAALPIAGVDGTLEKRFKGSGAERLVRAKTGLLTGVVGLAGYASRPSGEILAFSFVYNGGADGAHVRKTFDEMAAALTK